MPRAKQTYTKQATSLDDQVAILRSRGVIINDEEKAKEYLSDIGYYRLGFYTHPFEITYPELGGRRRHDVQPVTHIEDIVALYYYDLDLRTLLNRYLSLFLDDGQKGLLPCINYLAIILHCPPNLNLC